MDEEANNGDLSQGPALDPQKVFERFSHLCKPLREFSDNWNIDISEELEEYVLTLSSLQEHFTESNAKINFAEVAMIIQGSAAVYGRKVEFLHNLVYQALSSLVEGTGDSKKIQKGNKYRKNATKISKAEEDLQEKIEEFLSLDDVIPIHNNTRLEDKNCMEEEDTLRDHCPEEFLQGSSDLNGSLQLLRFGVHPSGAMEYSSSKTLGNTFDKILKQQRKEVSAKALLPDFCEFVASQSHIEIENARDRDTNNFTLDFGGFDQDIGNEGDSMCGESIDNEEYNFEGENSFDGVDHAFERDPSFEKTSSAHENLKPKPVKEIWRMMDRFSNGLESLPGENTIEQKLIKSKPFRKINRRKRRLKREECKNDSKPMEEKFFYNMHSDGSRTVSNMAQLFNTERSMKKFQKVVDGSRDNCFPLLTSALRSLLKDKKKYEKKLGYNQKKVDVVALNEDENREALRYEDNDDIQGIDFSDDESSIGLGGGDAEHMDGDRETIDFGDFDDIGLASPGNSDINSAQRVTFGNDDFSAPLSYVELVKQHVSRFLKKASNWARESKLDLTVREWQEKLSPVLEEQELHPEFDIHIYGGKILSNLEKVESLKVKKTERVSFEGVLDTDCPKFETCRLFLATLQLANNQNVELSHDSNYSQLKLKLLDSVLADEKIEHDSQLHT